MYAFCYSAIKRLFGAGNVLAHNTIRMPNNAGLIFNVTWDKTLRMDTHCFGFLCMSGIEPWCAHCIIDEWVSLAKEILNYLSKMDYFFLDWTMMGQLSMVKDGEPKIFQTLWKET